MFTDDGEAEPLSKLFARMNEQAEDNPAPDTKSSKNVMFEYLADVLPNFDKDQVHVSDIKRLLKWYHFIKDNDLFGSMEEE